jgi:hypothetical protein
MPPQVNVPILKDLTIDNITENVYRINSQAQDARLKYILERLVSHMHDFARETRLSTNEWLTGIEFLTQVGKKCTDVRQVMTAQHLWRTLREGEPPKYSWATDDIAD